MKSWQLLSLPNANRDVRQKAAGAIIFQVMKMENREGSRAEGLRSRQKLRAIKDRTCPKHQHGL